MSERDAAEVISLTDTGTATLSEMMRAHENTIIRQALIASRGRVTRAALLLGVSHQRLISILNNRQRDLLALRTPIRTRKRSLINEARG